MKCNLECPYSKWNGTNPNGTKSIICKSRNWFMDSSDDCIERFTEENIQQLINIYGSPIHERYKVFKQIDGDDEGRIFVTAEEVIVDLDQAPTDGSNAVALTLTEICELLNKQDPEIQQLKQQLLFYLDVAVSETSSCYKKEMENSCQKLFGCTHKEAKEQYGGFEEDWETDCSD